MQTSFLVWLIVLTTALGITSCTTNPVPEEEFEGPAGNFPRLADVPDRPTLPKLNRDKLVQELDDRNKESNKIKDIIIPPPVETSPES